VLLPPANNGGPTRTLLPAADSPAINSAIGCPTPAIDQRGVSRPVGAACDVGAVERVPESRRGGTPVGPDLTAPVLSDFIISALRFRTGRPTRRSRTLGRFTHLVFDLSERANVDFRFDRRAAGRRGPAGRCQRPARRNRNGRGCVRWLPAGSLADSLLQGVQTVRFNGNVTVRGRGRTLHAGFYRVRIQAIDPAGNRSVPVGGRFRVVR
jgi:hypothetical protein